MATMDVIRPGVVGDGGGKEEKVTTGKTVRPGPRDSAAQGARNKRGVKR
jgi:hypothetical protein